MTIPNYNIKPNPREKPVYPYSYTDHYIEIVDGKFKGVHFSLGTFRIIGDEEDKKIIFDYNLLWLPDEMYIAEEELEKTIGEILQQLIELGHYEFNTKL